MGWSTLFGLVFLVIGVGLWTEHDRMTEGRPVEGVVKTVDDDGWGVISYFVDGEQWETENDVLGHQVGDSVLVVYDPKDPSYGYIQGDPFDETIHWWFLGGGALLLLPAAYLLLVAAYFYWRGRREGSGGKHALRA